MVGLPEVDEFKVPPLPLFDKHRSIRIFSPAASAPIEQLSTSAIVGQGKARQGRAGELNLLVLDPSPHLPPQTVALGGGRRK